MSRVGLYICPNFFKYFGPTETQGNYLYQCLKCPIVVDCQVKPSVLYSCCDKSRNNLKAHMKVRHYTFFIFLWILNVYLYDQSKNIGMFDSFVSACQSSAEKRKRVDVEACNVSGSESCSSSNSQISVKEGFSNTFKVRKAIYTQKEFDHYICNYIVVNILCKAILSQSQKDC